MLDYLLSVKFHRKAFLIPRFGYHSNSLQPNISKQVLHTVIYTLPAVVTKRICIMIKSLVQFAVISFNLPTSLFDSWVILLGEIKYLSLLGRKRVSLNFSTSFFFFSK